MAIAYQGYDTVDDSDGTVSATVTVPANANYAILFICGYSNPHKTVSTAPTLGGKAMALLNAYTPAGYYAIWAYGLVSPPTGSKTLALAMSGAFTAGGIYDLAFFSGVDPADPIALVDATYNGNAGGTASDQLINQDNGDMIVLGGVADAPGNNCNIELQDQTAIIEDNTAYNGSVHAMAYKTVDSADETVQLYGDYPSLNEIVLKQAAAGGTTSVPQMMMHYARLRRTSGD